MSGNKRPNLNNNTASTVDTTSSHYASKSQRKRRRVNRLERKEIVCVCLRRSRNSCEIHSLTPQKNEFSQLTHAEINVLCSLLRSQSGHSTLSTYVNRGQFRSHVMCYLLMCMSCLVVHVMWNKFHFLYRFEAIEWAFSVVV